MTELFTYELALLLVSRFEMIASVVLQVENVGTSID